MDDHQFKDEENESVGELSTVCSQIVLTCLYLDRIGRPDLPWSVNKLARAVTKWTKSCDTRLARLISYMHQDSDFAEDLQDSKKNRRNSVHFRKSHVCIMCKKQTSVSRNSTEAEIISLDAGLRMDGIPALTHWDLVIEVFCSVPNRTDGPKREPRGNPSATVKPNVHNPILIKHTNVIPTNIESHSTKYNAFESQFSVVCL